MDNRDKYIEFCQTNEVDIPLFHQPWWLDAVAPGWRATVVEKGGEVVAVMPYLLKQKWGLKFILPLPLTQKSGPLVKYPENQKYSRRLAYEKEVFTLLIEQLPKFHFFSQNFSHRLKNVLPFYWEGFSARVRYNYVIFPDSKEKIFSAIDNKRNIKKAEKDGITVSETDDIKLLFSLVKETFNRQNKKLPFDIGLLQRLDKNLKQHGRRKIQTAYDSQGNLIAANYLVWDNERVYYLLGGIKTEFTYYRASNLLIWRAIEFATDQGKIFDFEGSMHPGIEKFFRSFGARQEIFFNVYKVRGKFSCLINCLKPIV